MGSPASEKNRGKDEAQVAVTISRSFYLGKYVVTQGEFKAVMGKTPWAGKKNVKEGNDYPATFVNGRDVREFCRKLTEREAMAGRLPQGWRYDLPTEAQWEYACRAATTTAYSFGNDAGKLSEYAWWGGLEGDANAKDGQYAHRVGQKKPNPWGLYDMHGNVQEPCLDAYCEKLPGGMDRFVLSVMSKAQTHPWQFGIRGSSRRELDQRRRRMPVGVKIRCPELGQRGLGPRGWGRQPGLPTCLG